MRSTRCTYKSRAAKLPTSWLERGVGPGGTALLAEAEAEAVFKLVVRLDEVTSKTVAAQRCSPSKHECMNS